MVRWKICGRSCSISLRFIFVQNDDLVIAGTEKPRFRQRHLIDKFFAGGRTEMETGVFAAINSIGSASENQSPVATGGQSADALKIFEVAHGQAAGDIGTAPAGGGGIFGGIEEEDTGMVGGGDDPVAGKSQAQDTAAFPVRVETRKLALSGAQLAPPAAFAR